MKNKNLNFKKRIAVLFITATVAITACKKQSYTPVSQDEIVTYIKSLGFSQKDIKDIGNYYLVDGDMLFAKNATIDPAKTKLDLSKLRSPALHTEQTGTGSYVTSIATVVVQIDPSMSGYQTEITAAINEWNNVSSGLTFTLYTGTGPSPNITIIADNTLPTNVCGEALFPVNGQPGAEVFIATNFISSLGFNSAQVQYVISHELGHTIGFRHTNWYPNESSYGTDRIGNGAGAYQIPNTPNQYGYTSPDPNSIMNGGECGFSFTSLSTYDQIAFQFLYPVNGSHPAAPAPYNISGNFIRNDDTGQVYMVMDGVMRYIPTTDVLFGLFDFNESLMVHYTTAQLANAVYGTTISIYNGLLNDNYTGKVYFRELSTLRWIPTMTVKAQYHFNWSNITYQYGTSGYTIGPDM